MSDEKPSAPHALAAEPVRRIAILRALFVGDLLMTTPAFRALRERWPDAEITLIGLPWAEEMAPHLSPLVDRFETFPGYPGIPEQEADPETVERWLGAQRARRYDLALQMHGDGTIMNAVVTQLDARVSAGFSRPGDGRLTYSLPVTDEGNEVLRWLGLTDMLGAPRRGTELLFRLRPEDLAAADALLAAAAGSGPLVGLHAGSKSATRRWPPERFAEAADALVERRRARVVLTGSMGERELTGRITAAMRHPALDLAGRTGIGAFGGVVSRLDLLLTNDTGASHLAAATRAPSVVVFGSERPDRFAPLDAALHRVVDAVAHAGPGADRRTALLALPPEPVIALCAQMLAERAGRPNDGASA